VFCAIAGAVLAYLAFTGDTLGRHLPYVATAAVIGLATANAIFRRKRPPPPQEEVPLAVRLRAVSAPAATNADGIENDPEGELRGAISLPSGSVLLVEEAAVMEMDSPIAEVVGDEPPPGPFSCERFAGNGPIGSPYRAIVPEYKLSDEE
jgi:hypothetical protein